MFMVEHCYVIKNHNSMITQCHELCPIIITKIEKKACGNEVPKSSNEVQKAYYIKQE